MIFKKDRFVSLGAKREPRLLKKTGVLLVRFLITERSDASVLLILLIAVTSASLTCLPPIAQEAAFLLASATLVAPSR